MTQEMLLENGQYFIQRPEIERLERGVQWDILTYCTAEMNLSSQNIIR